MKKLVTKLSTCILMSFLLVNLFICSTPVKASSPYSIQPYAYYSKGSIQFKGSRIPITKNYDGTFMAIEAKSTSSSGNIYDVTIYVTIASRKVTNKYTISTNGSLKKFLGLSGSSDVSIECKCNSSDTINIELTSYSW